MGLVKYAATPLAIERSIRLSSSTPLTTTTRPAKAVGSQSLGGFEPVEVGHLDVEQVQVGCVLACELDCVRAVGGGADRLVAERAQRLREAKRDQRVVLG
jgi:hypothetical protein